MAGLVSYQLSIISYQTFSAPVHFAVRVRATLRDDDERDNRMTPFHRQAFRDVHLKFSQGREL